MTDCKPIPGRVRARHRHAEVHMVDALVQPRLGPQSETAYYRLMCCGGEVLVAEVDPTTDPITCAEYRRRERQGTAA